MGAALFWDFTQFIILKERDLVFFIKKFMRIVQLFLNTIIRTQATLISLVCVFVFVI